MLYQIILESSRSVRSNKNDLDHVENKIQTPIHESFVGNKDYIDSNIVFNADYPSVGLTLYANCDKCYDKAILKEKLKNSIDIFIDNL